MKIYLFGVFFCISGVTLSNSTQAFSIIYPGSVTSSIKDGKNLKVSEFIILSPKDYSKITGKKLNLSERISFSIMKLRMKHVLKNNPNMTVSECMAAHKKPGKGWWILIGAVAGLLLIMILFSIE
ncbi:hypothetical protein FW778_13270 [Ginsengibacter hankyongi]|uniref:Uncharacterized protein n=1 Tax=Ginsengibacter hankyongi TaxID=2607284 RepID=A0A5J5IH27_9BACT|nr:hypothetical protein [Ginsengibacter hankyongi]KAA9038526.1 hypothetical protein FW778_13270 [Ginsengibacter hankyongi]